MIACVAIIAKENNPILLRVFSEGVEESKFHYICYCAIDLFEEKEQVAKPAGGGRQADMFLGLLYPVEDYKVYGYVSSTGVRFVLVVDDSDSKDNSIVKAFFKKVHGLFIDCVSNPFYRKGQPLPKPLERDLSTLVRLWNTDAFTAR